MSVFNFQDEVNVSLQLNISHFQVKLANYNRMKAMEQVHLAGEDEDDLYSGYNDYNATLDTEVY